MSNLSTAFALAEVTTQTVSGQENAREAMKMFHALGVTPTNENLAALMEYSACLSADLATRIVSILMSEKDFHSMVTELNEFENLGLEWND